MGCLGNILWFLFGGLFLGLGWCVTGVLWCLTLIGIPVGVQCFKLAGMAFWPFGKEVVHSGGTGSFLLNLLWLLGGGLILALESAMAGIPLCVTIIGIPFGKQCFKLAKLSLMPFGAEIIGG